MKTNTKYDYQPGNIIYWWRGNTDYPSIVELIQPVEKGWIVNYAYISIDEDWFIPFSEMGRILVKVPT